MNHRRTVDSYFEFVPLPIVIDWSHDHVGLRQLIDGSDFIALWDEFDDHDERRRYQAFWRKIKNKGFFSRWFYSVNDVAIAKGKIERILIKHTIMIPTHQSRSSCLVRFLCLRLDKIQPVFLKYNVGWNENWRTWNFVSRDDVGRPVLSNELYSKNFQQKPC